MEIGESLGLADQFLLSLIFKVHSLPRNERGEGGRRWWRTLDTRLGPGAALNEHRRQLEIFAADRQVDRERDRQLFVTISAIVEDQGKGRCPALQENSCGVYERRPLTCRTVPLHYSRPPSSLAAYLDGFVSTPGYRCSTSEGADILQGDHVLSDEIRRAREEAVRVAERDRDWKDVISGLMKDRASARAAGLPTTGDVITNSDRGYASTVPIFWAWRAAASARLICTVTFADLCAKQIALIEAVSGQWPDRAADLADRARLYRSGLTGEAGAATQTSDTEGRVRDQVS